MKRISLIVGARPNFVKAAAILNAADMFPQFDFKLIHLGQHTGAMSDPYFRDLRLPEPDFAFGPFIGTPIQRLGAMIDLVQNAICDRPDAVMVVGDTDSTLAGALAAAESGIPIVHVEAGLRTGNMQMQEEVNRRIVDSVSSIHYCTSRYAQDNLANEGVKNSRLVGNVMVDTLYRFLPESLSRYPKRKNPYALLTLHRAELVDDYEKYERVMDAIAEISLRTPVIWPRHPRCRRLGVAVPRSVITVDPMGYLEFVSTMANAEFVMTDSGGVQEETTALGVKCLTLRDDTERPETIKDGSNVLVGTDPTRISHAAHVYGKSTIDQFPKPDLWDGNSAGRIMEDLCATL